ncbi:hypothetical protein HYN48_03675 [Flavobacterium magnum]|uniref:Beta-carotene 15,15'-monooxygenase n=1 Tax=Flavobacterium magnum TaxID=2162713 RepID=A0A2S0RDC6_9FLAO|nr:hypothetical protein [Flavobacterium magnum]AWA29258.1 hypothetical protein HYN48_03675 [Flavobacterium magnum]
MSNRNMGFFSKKHGIFELIILVFLISIFNHLTYVVATDIQLHAQFIKSYADGQIPFQVNFMYYFTVYALSFYSSDLILILFVSIYVLAALTYFKYYVVKKIVYSEIEGSAKNPVVVSSLAAFSLLVCFSLPSILFLDNIYYLANFPANIWHNSTIIFAMPFVVMLFWVSLKQISEYKHTRTLAIIFLIALNIVIKPSFIFVYVIAFPLINLLRFKFGRHFWLNLIPVVAAFIFVILQYYYVFISAETITTQSSVKIHFFNVLAHWTGSTHWYQILFIVLSTVISSYLFPLVFLTRNRGLLKQDMVLFAVFCAVIGLLIFYALSETGAREFDGNFIWQTFMCSFLLFFVCIVQLLKSIFDNPLGWKAYKIEIIAFSLHLISGIYYFYRLISLDTYN